MSRWRARGRGVADHADEPKRLDARGFALQFERFHGVDVNRVTDERACLAADQDLAGRRRLLETSRHVDRVARDERLALAPHDNLAGVDPDSRFEPVCHDRVAHLGCGPNRAKRVVLVRDGDSEDGHDGISGELLHRASVALEDGTQVLEVALKASAQRFRIGRLSERRRADEVAEEDRDDLALLAHRRSLRGASRAEVVEHRS